MRAALIALLAAGCVAAQPPPEARPEPAAAASLNESVVPGSIGALVKQSPTGLVVSALRREGAAARAGLRAGDIVLSYNGVPVSTPREFNTLVIDSLPGSAARVELLRNGRRHLLEIHVREVDTMPRV